MPAPTPFAFWRKCDFQVHTPRDPNWKGARPLGVGETNPATGAAASIEEVETSRADWAEAFVAKCAEKGLQAVALTDHHEMVMVRYVQQAIAERTRWDPDFNLWLFPGMELSTSGGCQCLILFDRDLPTNRWREIQSKLGIAYTSQKEEASVGPKVEQLSVDYPDIQREIVRDFPDLFGQFIVMPNVSNGGAHTVLKDRAHANFSRMPYAGGYLDRGQTKASLGSRNQTRLSGTAEKWSRREIYPLPTSDCREADYGSLGTNNTWIKLAAPSAEAIRQAFLGHRSRIRLTPPELPSLYVAGVEIRDSTILDDVELALSPELNAVIGGRGTGKSSMLEYIAFGLGRASVDIERTHYSNTKRMKELMTNTLVSEGGHVRVRIILDNATFVVDRGPETSHQPQVTYPDGASETVSSEELRRLFPAVVYSQGELAEIGKVTGEEKPSLSDLLQFVDVSYKREDDRIATDIDLAKNEVRSGVQSLATHWTLQAELRKLTSQRVQISQRIAALEKTLPTLSPQDEAARAAFDKANEFETKRRLASAHADECVRELDAVSREILSQRDLQSDVPEAASVQNEYANLYRAVEDGLNELLSKARERRTVLNEAETTWSKHLADLRSARDAVLAKLGEHTTATTQIVKLQEELADLDQKIGSLQARLDATGSPAEELDSSVLKLRALGETRDAKVVEWAAKIEELSSGTIRAHVTLGADIGEARDALDKIGEKTGSQAPTRLRELDELLKSEAISGILARIRTECLALLRWRLLAASEGAERPASDTLLGLLGRTERIRSTLADLMDVPRIEAVATVVTNPQTRLTYCDGAREIAFANASEGQRAAALLFMLLEQQGEPLIVDQPEGDLDNKIISALTAKLHAAKECRQMIFASHDANIVVNGSSELVAHMDTSDTGSRYVQSNGAIDTPSICELIAETMEGGKKAFQDRLHKYGY